MILAAFASRLLGAAIVQADGYEASGDWSVVLETVTFPPEVDVSNSEAVGRELLAAFRPGMAVVIADLSRTDFCDSSAISYLIIAHNQAARTGAELRVVTSSATVRRALNVLGADQMLHMYPDMLSALTSVPTEAPRAGEEPSRAADLKLPAAEHPQQAGRWQVTANQLSLLHPPAG